LDASVFTADEAGISAVGHCSETSIEAWISGWTTADNRGFDVGR
jgi:hypothetical protein